MSIYVILCLIILCLAMGGFAIGYYFMRLTFYPNVFSHAKIYNDEIERGIVTADEFDLLEKEIFWIDTGKAYELKGYWIPAEKSDRTVIIVHGYTNNIKGAIRYISIFREKGFNVLIYDQRYHGESGGRNCTFGYHEKSDLEKVFDWVENKQGIGSVIGIHGESMGASTAIMHGAIDNRASFIIADCPFSDLHLQFGNRLEEDYHLPSKVILALSSWVTYILTGISYKVISPIEDIKKINTPICFIHGKSDTFTDCSQSIALHDMKKSAKTLYLVENANHAQAILVNPQKYKEVIHNFIDSLNIDT